MVVQHPPPTILSLKMNDAFLVLPTLPNSVAEIQELPRFTHVSQTGVYFLFDKETVVYVGQGQDIPARIAHHAFAGKKRFDSYAYIPCPAAQLNQLEAHFIYLLQPYYNKNVPLNDTYKSLLSIKKALAISMNVLKRYMQHQHLPLTQATYHMADFASLNLFIAWMQAEHPRVLVRQCSVSYWEWYLKEQAHK